jgi:acetoin utilization deacetylase AcuC-like enzyme
MTLYHDPGFAAPIGNHIMPISKFGLVAAEAKKAFPDIAIVSPDPVTVADLLRVHAFDYISAVKTGEPRSLAESQKFPWSPELFSSVCLTGGGVLAAAREALSDGISGALASGFHHACFDHGEGFCTFNGLVVALEALRASGQIHHAAVLDLDLHYGNGTAQLAEDRSWMRALSIYGNDYDANTPYRDVRSKRHVDGENHFSVPLIPSGSSDRNVLLQALEEHLDWILEGEKPDILLYQAGADPLRDDPYSPLDLNHADLMERDRLIFEFAKRHSLPVAWVLAGGYTEDISKVVEVHLNTLRACVEVFG